MISDVIFECFLRSKGEWPLNLWWISNKTIMEVGNITKAATFKSFLHLSYQHTITFLVTVLFNLFRRQTLNDDFWGWHKNTNCAFPLTILKGKTVFHSIQYKNGCLAASDLFHMFTESIEFYTLYYQVLKSTDVWKMWFIK